MMRCSSCGFENPDSMRYCGRCGDALGEPSSRCPECAFDNPAGFTFCGRCGATLQARAAADLATSGVEPGAERRQLSVMFCDLVGSTALSEQLDPEELRDVVRRYQGVASRVVERFDGYVAQYLGDGLLVYFGYPQAHEDDARRAVRAGLGIVRKVGELADELEPSLGSRLAVRIGVHTGPVVTGAVGSGERREQLALGATPNLAARLQELAAPGEVVLSDETRRLVVGHFELEARGRSEVKGATQPVEVFRAVAVREVTGSLEEVPEREIGPLVDRGLETELLLQRAEQARQGNGQAVLIAGEAGIGKSRLIRAFRELARQRGFRWWIGSCSPYSQDSAFRPVIEALRRSLKVRGGLPPETYRRRLDKGLSPYGLAEPRTLALFAHLLGLPAELPVAEVATTPQRRRELTLEAILTLIVREAERRPLILAVEDLHWVDPSTQELLDLLLARIETLSVLVLLSFRPSYSAPWRSRPRITQLFLDRLADEDVEELVEHTAGTRTLPAALREQIRRRTDGVPLFVEELTKMVLESDLAGDGGDAASRGLAIPATLRDSLMARLDRLEEVKSVAQLGAVIGRDFSWEMLRTVSPLDDSRLAGALDALEEAGLVYPRGALSSLTYTFKHALIQDVAYESLLRSARADYHARIGEALEASFPEVVDSQPELVARHYTEAGRQEPAIDFWQRAAEQAVERSANREAIIYLRRGLGLLAELPASEDRDRRELGLQTLLGAALQEAEGYTVPEVEEAYRRAQELGDRIGDAETRFRIRWGLAALYQIRGELEEAFREVQELVTLAELTEDPNLLTAARVGVGAIQLYQGKLRSTERELGASERYFEQLTPSGPWLVGSDPGVAYLLCSARVAWLRGRCTAAQRSLDAALERAREMANPYTLCYVLAMAALHHRMRRCREPARDLAAEAIDLSSDHAFSFFMAIGEMVHGWAEASDGIDAGLERIRQALASYRASGSRGMLTELMGILAEAGVELEDASAEETVRQALEVAATTGERHWESELLRLRGEIERAAGSTDAAEQTFQAAIAAAAAQGARSLELRAAWSLGRLWRAGGRGDEALELLNDRRARLAEPDRSPETAALEAWLAE